MKKSLAIALALMLVLAFASSAMAAQVLQDGSYLSTTATGMSRDGVSTGSAFSRTYQTSKFVADGVTNYPYEIYLPNETNPASYRIHSNYAKNTDACASCHSTHTAVGASLLQWYSAYETCMACHDGTVTTTYDVATGTIGALGSKAAMGGAFNGTGGSASNHNVTGAMSIAAAPGGSTVENIVTLGGESKKQWTPEFGCESCHTPHGMGGNARILHPDPNFAATAAKPDLGYAVVSGHVYALTDTTYTKALYILKEYPYNVSIEDADGVVAAAYITNVNGYSEVIGGVATKVYGTAALTVRMNIENYLVGNAALPADEEKVAHVSGMNAFCGTCHTDYNTDGWTNSLYATPQTTSSGAYETGTYSKAHRHQVGNAVNVVFGTKLAGAAMPSENGKLECLTCHVAHGVSADFWEASLSASTGEYKDDHTATTYVELAGSSALKRQPNMGVCETCHDKSTGNEGYAANSGADSTSTPVVVDGIFGQATATYVGFTDIANNGANACANCHTEYVEKYLDTQHPYVIAPYITANYFTAFDKVTNKDGNASQEAIDALNAFNAVAGPVIQATIESNGSTFDPKNTFSIGQLPIGNVKFAVRTTLSYNSATSELYEIAEFVFTDGAWQAPTVLNEVKEDYKAACFTCHTTLAASDAEAKFNDYQAFFVANATGTRPVADLSITCEACHGQASNHLKAPSAKNIFNPRNVDPQTSAKVCGRCHTSAEKVALYDQYAPWKLVSSDILTADVTDASGTYVAGTKFKDVLSSEFAFFYDLDVASNSAPTGETTGTDYTYGPKDDAGTPWIAARHVGYTSFTTNNHYKKNLVSCASCHDSHSDDIKAQLKLGEGAICASCHDSSYTVSKCMPKTVFSRLHDFGKIADPVTKKWVNPILNSSTDFPGGGAPDVPMKDTPPNYN